MRLCFSTILGSLKHAIHVWNGGDTYEYDWKTSISKANELEEVLQGTIVMYREVRWILAFVMCT